MPTLLAMLLLVQVLQPTVLATLVVLVVMMALVVMLLLAPSRPLARRRRTGWRALGARDVSRPGPAEQRATRARERR